MKQVRRLLSVIMTVVLVVGTLYIGGNVNAATTVSSITISTDDYVLAAEENPNDPGGNGIVAYDESLADHINFYVNRYLDSDNLEQFYNGMTPFVEGTTYVLMLKVDTPKPGVVFADSLQVTAVMKGYSIALKMNKYITEGSIYYSCYYTMPKQSDLPTATANYDVSTGKVAISWTKKKSNSNYYKLYLQVMSNGSWTDKSVSPISSQQTSTSYTYNAAYDAPGSYRIKIAEYTSSASQSPNATQYSNQYAIEEPLDYKPENVKVTADSSGKYWFTWTKPAAAKNAQYYVLEGSIDGKIWNQLEKYSASYTEANISVENYKTILNPEIGAVNYFRICYETPTGGRSAYSDVVSSKYDNYEKNKDQLIAECEKLKKTPAKISYAGGFDVKKTLAAGMKKTYDHPSYNLSIECIKFNKSLAFKYTLTTK
nr:hypothetical protein [Eubacterium sp.]